MHARTLALLALSSALASGCGDDPSPTDAASDLGADASDVLEDVPPNPPARDLPYTPPPRSRVVSEGVRREVFRVPAPAPPANPTRGTATPSEYNAVQVVRYRVDSVPPRPARAVVVAMPGFLGGAASFDPLARAIVRRSAAEGQPVELWALDRRANLLEDLRGMDVAEATGDPEVAQGYYLDRDVTVGGQRFQGFPDPNGEAVSYLSEWGLATTLEDLRAVVSLVPESRDHVVLLGHSLGASLVEAYAAWDFLGTPGYNTVAGLVLVDGVLGGEAISEQSWREGGSAGPGGMPFTGLTALRASGPYYVALPLIGVQSTVSSEIVARRAARAPDAVARDPYRDRTLRLLLGLSPLPPLTNAAAFGLAFDDRSQPLSFARMSLGRPEGAVTTRANPFASGERLEVPESPTETVRWVDAPRTTPREFTPLAHGIAAWAATPTNFSEWYFPSRLTLDVAALGDLRAGEGSWQWREGLRARHGGSVDVPVLGVAAALVGSAAAFDRVRARLAPSVGEGRPGAGAPRTAEAGFRALFVPGMSHLDPLTASEDHPGNPVPEAVTAFSVANTRGSVTVPVRD